MIAEKIKSEETNPVVSQLDAWEYARRNANGVVDDPVTQQVLEDVIAISNQLEEHGLTNIGTDDLLARLIPLEYSGRVRAVGWGVTKTSLQKISSRSELTKLKHDIAFLKNELKELKCKGYVPGGGASGGSSHMDNFDMDDDVNSDHIDDYDTFLSEDLPERKNPCYLYLDPGHRYVGRRILWNDLNDRMLHGVQLEDGYVRVQFEVAAPSELKTELPRPCDEANLVGDAPGYFLAWPRKLISMNLEIPPKTKNKEKNVEKNKNAIRQEKVKDKEKQKLVESTGVSSKQLGYPLPQDVSHDGVSELVLNEQWFNASSLAFYIRYLCEVYLSKNPNLASNYSFASPHIVFHFVNISEASTNLAKLMLGYVDKEHLLALKSFRTGCGKIHLKMAFNSFKWMNVSCPKQVSSDGIFCGYYVGCFIEDILRSGETSINVNFTRSSRLMCYGYDKMVRFRDNWAGFLYNRFLKGKLLNM
ncbi:hypothetical protein POM88_024161 [Heracleum sosnowskyi]|uniref:DUF8039 domain-containing protein n=1 Tax=Heracleum sosnowskyi TaxID=360622 RepID=A0AAD8MLP7_9APIA|nr:hypothetical protein POM88_024161 [Heracleum sosnowskyi]